MTTPTNNIAPVDLTNAAAAYFKADATLTARRKALGDMLSVGGFDIATDFAAATAKKADRADRFEAIKFLAQEGFPAAVTAALRNDDLAGKAMVKADGKALSKTDWSKLIGGKIRTLQSAFGIYLAESESAADSAADSAKKGAKANAPRELATRIAGELAKLISAVRKDKEGEPTAKFDHAAMLKALTAAADLAE